MPIDRQFLFSLVDIDRVVAILQVLDRGLAAFLGQEALNSKSSHGRCTAGLELALPVLTILHGPISRFLRLGLCSLGEWSHVEVELLQSHPIKPRIKAVTVVELAVLLEIGSDFTIRVLCPDIDLLAFQRHSRSTNMS